MTNKNPYEIRSDILALAKDYLDKQTQANTNYLNSLVKLNQEAASKFLESFKPFYTLDDLQKVADQMYTFVSNK